MKVVTASTPEQHDYVKCLMKELYENIFPIYFSNAYIQKLKNFELMTIPNMEELNLNEIMEVTASLQTIATILKQFGTTNEMLEEYEQVFSKNTIILTKYGIDFPFQLTDFKLNSNYCSSKQNSLYI
ncbi:YhcU family protein [Aquibacillus koreensis]|uniref:YhcU family protein n=1 Tax=Aquibacillus koreensis TaxID=279446 RepID=A0A9X3WML1_9BACI|nr:YhcU family protein [Aquibacillus koreensis]MCT2535046.1 YhcU family protein [Aquibacillus koreensis]MDC3422832.1 YhcU family protein [Aquibacillus koreensis]